MATEKRRHLVLGTALLGPYPQGVELLYLAMGCFWGAEKRMWRIPGVHTTAVGYQGGTLNDPTYEQVCSAATGHAETVLIAYDPRVVPTWEVLRTFWENHDPTQGDRQGNDSGSQYRSAAFWTTDEQGELLALSADLFGTKLRDAGLGAITTTAVRAMDDPSHPAGFHLAEQYHQQYLARVPRGYDCHAHTGIRLPDLPRESRQ